MPVILAHHDHCAIVIDGPTIDVDQPYGRPTMCSCGGIMADVGLAHGHDPVNGRFKLVDRFHHFMLQLRGRDPSS